MIKELELKYPRLLGIIYALSGSILWGFCGVIAEGMLKDGVPNMWLNFYRLVFAVIILMALVGFKQESKKLLKDKQAWLPLAVFGVFGLMSSQLCYYLSIYYSDAGSATAFQYIYPALVIFYLSFREKVFPKAQEFLALIFALGGIWLLATKGQLNTIIINVWAIFWGVGSAITMVIYTISAKGIIIKYGVNVVVAYGLLLGTIAFICVSGVWNIPYTPSIGVLLKILVIVLLGTILAFILFLRGVGLIGASMASVIGCIEPASAAFFSWWLVGTQFVLGDIIGFICIVLSVLLVIKK